MKISQLYIHQFNSFLLFVINEYLHHFSLIINPNAHLTISFYLLQIHNLDSAQFDAIEKTYNITLDALSRGNAFAMAINGGPGSGKSQILLEILIAFVRSELMNKKKIRILVTGATDDVVDSLASKLHRIRDNSRNIPPGILK